MPELPEVETTRRGIEPHVLHRRISDVIVRQPRLRWPVSRRLRDHLRGAEVLAIERRGKYLLFRVTHGTVIVHLGMSGSLRMVSADMPVRAHDHIDVVFTGNEVLRFHDPRRFGAWLWCRGDPFEHALLNNLGPEPLSDGFGAAALYRSSRGRRVAVKNFIMDARVVAGVGNIYANEALFRARIHPQRAAGRIAAARYTDLVAAIRAVLSEALAAGGTTLRDFVNGSGEPGYFKQCLAVYDRAGQPCRRCGSAIRLRRDAQRATFYCPHCQR
jgi:formamidopyrimidine-DNA glycosylase